MRRDELAALGVQLPVLPTIVLGALPGEPTWAARLARLGVDVVCSGADEDTLDLVALAREAAPHRPVKARMVDAAGLAGLDGVIVETVGDVPSGSYRLGPDDAAVEGVDGASDEVEDVMDVARRTLAAARAGVPSALWVVATPGLDLLPDEVVERKLAVLAEGATQARLYLAKEQFDI